MKTETLVATADVTGGAQKARWVSGRRARVLLCVSGVSFMIMLDSNIVAVSLPAIARSLQAVFADLEWVVSAYVLTFAAFLLPAGTLADRFGRRRILLIGLALFTLASLLCGLAPSARILNAARALQGVGAALQLSAALAVLAHEFRGAERAKAFGFWGTVIGIAVALGPPIGGLITSTLGWRWAFLVNVPIGIALLLLSPAAVLESRDPDSRRLDIAGMLLFGSGLSCLVWALIGMNSEASVQETYIKAAIGIGLLILFLGAEFVQARPMIDLGLFRRRTFLGSAFAMLGFASAAQVMLTYLPLYLQNVFGQSAVQAGLGMLPLALPLFFGPRIGVALSARFSGRTVLALGLGVVALGDLVTAGLVAAHATYYILAIGMFITGCGAGLLNGETAKVSMSVVPPERGGMASGISATLRFVGLVTGITGLGAILAHQAARHLLLAEPVGGIAISDNAALRGMVSRIIAGDISGLLAPLPPSTQGAMRALAQSTFAAGFEAVLLVAAGIAIVATGLTLFLVNAAETPPTHGPGTGEPVIID